MITEISVLKANKNSHKNSNLPELIFSKWFKYRKAFVFM